MRLNSFLGGLFSDRGGYAVSELDKNSSSSEPVLTGYRRTDVSTAELDLRKLLERYANTPGVRGMPTVERLKERNFSVPDTVWRTHRDPMCSRETAGSHGLRLREPSQGDDYLARIIMHSSSTSGSGGLALSLSTRRAVSERFLHHQDELFEIDTRTCHDKFKSINDIILNDGARLAQKGFITVSTLCRAAQEACQNSENELFYIEGDIPARLLKLSK